MQVDNFSDSSSLAGAVVSLSRYRHTARPSGGEAASILATLPARPTCERRRFGVFDPDMYGVCRPSALDSWCSHRHPINPTRLKTDDRLALGAKDGLISA